MVGAEEKKEGRSFKKNANEDETRKEQLRNEIGEKRELANKEAVKTSTPLLLLEIVL